MRQQQVLKLLWFDGIIETEAARALCSSDRLASNLPALHEPDAPITMRTAESEADHPEDEPHTGSVSRKELPVVC